MIDEEARAFEAKVFNEGYAGKAVSGPHPYDPLPLPRYHRARKIITLAWLTACTISMACVAVWCWVALLIDPFGLARPIRGQMLFLALLATTAAWVLCRHLDHVITFGYDYRCRVRNPWER